jgi:putative ABC transport system permease protein
MVDPLVLLAATLLGAVALLSGVLALRHRLSLRIAIRNIRRARTRSLLVVAGLLVGTAIISGSLVVGDTVGTINVHYTYIAYGYTDEAVYGTNPTGGYLYFPATTAFAIVNASSSDPQIAGVSPEVVDVTQVLDRTTGIPQTNLNLIGSDANLSGALGKFTSDSGTSLTGPSSGQVFLDDLAAQQMNAHVGDTVTLFGARALTTTVGAVVHDDLRGGFLTAGLNGGSVFVDLPTAQFLENATGEVNFIAVTNAGSQVGGIGLSSSVSSALNRTLAETPGTSHLSVNDLLKNGISQANSQGSGITEIFLVFGLFSIVAGAMLIVGIFTMIAEERKGEMGMLRAIGLTRRAVVLSYYFEGLIYSVGSALAGTFVGVLTGYILLYAYTLFVPIGGVSPGVILGSFTFSNDSLITSYLAGFLLTLGTVVVASVRVSRLNIVRAIRDVPEPPPPLRTYTYLAYLGAAALVLGSLLFAATARGDGDVSYPMIGGGVAILGAGLVAARFVKNRTAFSVVGLALVLWSGLEPLQNQVLGTGHSGGIFVVFVEGVLMVGGALLLFAFNGPDLARALERPLAGRRGSTPATRLGLSYPSRRAARTSITLAIFALVLFTIVVLATYSSTLTGNLEDSISAQSGGYTFFGYSAQPIPDLPDLVASNASLAPLYSHVVPLVTGVSQLMVPGFGANPYEDSVYAAPAGAPSSSNFYDTNQFPFLSTYDGWTAGQVMTRLASNSSVAIVDANYASGGGFSSAPHPVVSVGTVLGVTNPSNGATLNVTVVGVLKEEVLTGVWLNPTAASALGYHATNGYLLTVHSGVSSTSASQRTKAAFYTYGLVLVDFASVLATTIALISGDIGLLEVFIGLGLAVGIAALGILALRAVVERRREIGMLRAIGMTRTMVLKSFLLEYSFVTLFGAAIGGALGLLIVYNLVVSPGASAAGVSQLYIPWENLVIVLATMGALATLAVIGPSLRAARLPPAEAIRSME